MRSVTKAALFTVGAIFAAVVVLGIGVLVLESLVFVFGPLPSYYYHIEYDNMHFVESEGIVDGVDMGSAGLHDWRLPAVYAEFPQCPGEIHFLPELKEDLAKETALRKTKRELGRKPETIYVLVAGDGAFCQIRFYDGQPSGLDVSGRTGIRISPIKDGEFIELPAKRSDIIRVFGKPLKIERKQAERMVH